jgi:regulator of protease activity HflC (stomatin/prohibitin superfamily)
MIRAIARQAEAERERRAKVIHADGEYQAAERLSQAAELLQRQPAAIQLRYLQTLVEIGSERSSTIVFPLPVDMLSAVTRSLQSWGSPGGGTNPLPEAEVRQPPPDR